MRRYGDGFNRFINLPGGLVHRLGKLEVEFCQSTCIMRVQLHLDPGIDIEPFRMVVELFCRKRRLRHEAEGFDEACEFEGFRDRCPTIIQRPTRQSGKLAVDRAPFQFLLFHVIVLHLFSQVSS
ncbi:hypothetical protein AJ87_34435 [Rhizobium yanglingense]|nr:hypothetical protein AJ87_34435 [Rhizobium yanglingense]